MLLTETKVIWEEGNVKELPPSEQRVGESIKHLYTLVLVCLVGFNF